MKEREYIVSDYSFSDESEFKEAKREAETIEYIRANTDLSDLNKALKLYNRLVERRTLNTVVGFVFLKELQDKIIKAGIISKDKLPNIPISKINNKYGKVTASSLGQGSEKKYVAIAEEYRIKHRNSKIINAFLLIIILAMLVINIMSDRSKISNYEEQITYYKETIANYEEEILDKYAGWKEDLNAREEALRKRESELMQQE